MWNVLKMGRIDDQIQQKIWHEDVNDLMCYIKTFVDVN
jgi:hypothetical protein